MDKRATEKNKIDKKPKKKNVDKRMPAKEKKIKQESEKR